MAIWSYFSFLLSVIPLAISPDYLNNFFYLNQFCFLGLFVHQYQRVTQHLQYGYYSLLYRWYHSFTPVSSFLHNQWLSHFVTFNHSVLVRLPVIQHFLFFFMLTSFLFIKFYSSLLLWSLGLKSRFCFLYFLGLVCDFKISISNWSIAYAPLSCVHISMEFLSKNDY